MPLKDYVFIFVWLVTLPFQITAAVIGYILRPTLDAFLWGLGVNK